MEINEIDLNYINELNNNFNELYLKIKDIIPKEKEYNEIEIKNYNEIIKILKEFRLLCSKGIKYQNEIISFSFITVIYNDICNYSDSFDKSSINFNILSSFVIIYFQILSNLVVNNQKNEKIIWDEIILSNKIQIILYMIKNIPKIYVCITMIIYNCIIHNNELLSQLLEENSFILSSLLLYSIQDNLKSDYNDFTYLLYIFILSNDNTTQNILKLLFKFTDSMIKKEQLIFLELFNLIITDKEFNPNQYSIETYELLYKILLHITLFLTLHTPKESNIIEMNYILYSNSIPLLCSILSYYAEKNEVLINEKTFNLDTIFTNFSKLFEIEIKEYNKNTQDFYSSILQLLSHLCYKNQYIQDLIRNKNLIIPILNSCKIDKVNPMSKEWALILV